MLRTTFHFGGETLLAAFESEHAFVKWLGYLKEHGLASVKLAEGGKQVIVFRDRLTFIEAVEGDLPGA